jgi:hypothetical protein
MSLRSVIYKQTNGSIEVRRLGKRPQPVTIPSAVTNFQPNTNVVALTGWWW